jgi:hypothetical protein
MNRMSLKAKHTDAPDQTDCNSANHLSPSVYGNAAAQENTATTSLRRGVVLSRGVDGIREREG